MDEAFRRLEALRAESPEDPDLAHDFARACLRLGHLRRALDVARLPGGAIYEEAAERLGASLELELFRLDPTPVFKTPERTELAYVAGGRFLDEGPHAFRSSVELGGERAPLRPHSLPAFLITVFPFDAPTRAEAERRVRRGRLPTAQEWKKAWRGGLYLDGDLLARDENPEPDRLRPAGLGAGAGIERSPYGVLFPLAQGGPEWCAEGNDWVCALADDGRYRIPLGTGGMLTPRARCLVELPDP